MKVTRESYHVLSERQHRLRDLFNRKDKIEQQVSGHGDPTQALESDTSVKQEYRNILSELAELL